MVTLIEDVRIHYTINKVDIKLVYLEKEEKKRLECNVV